MLLSICKPLIYNCFIIMDIVVVKIDTAQKAKTIFQTKPLSHNLTSYLEQCDKLLNSALGHNDWFSPTQQTQATWLRNNHFSTCVPDKSVKEEAPCTSKDAVHVPWVPLLFLQFRVTEPSNIFLQGRRWKDKKQTGISE